MRNNLPWLILGGVVLYLYSKRNPIPPGSGQECYPTNFVGPIPDGSVYCDEAYGGDYQGANGVTCLDGTGRAYSIPMGPCPPTQLELPPAGIPNANLIGMLPTSGAPTGYMGH